jgi:hypothetical protein
MITFLCPLLMKLDDGLLCLIVKDHDSFFILNPDEIFRQNQ